MSVTKIDELMRNAHRYQIPEGERQQRMLVPAHEVVASLREPEMVVAGMLERDTIASLVGQWGGGKTAVALDVTMRCAAGLPVHGRAVRAGLCVYVCGEGHAGFGRRLTAWAVHNHTRLQDVPLYLTQSAVPMPDPTGPANLQVEIGDLAEKLGLEPQIIVVDTLARNLKGDENSSADMGAFVQSVDTYLRRPFGACVLVLHHPGHGDKGRGRGASAFPAAVDVEYLLERDDELLRLSVGKPPKDFEAPEAMSWRLTPIPLLIGDTPASGITVSELTDDHRPAPRESTTKLSATERVALDALREVFGNPDLRVLATLELIEAGASSDVARVDDWRRSFYARHGADHEANKKAFQRVRVSLQAKQRIGCREDFAWIS